MASIDVRVAGSGDAGALASLRALWHPGDHGDLDERMAAWLAADGDRRTTWLATVAGEPAGMASLFEYRRMPRADAARLALGLRRQRVRTRGRPQSRHRLGLARRADRRRRGARLRAPPARAQRRCAAVLPAGRIRRRRPPPPWEDGPTLNAPQGGRDARLLHRPSPEAGSLGAVPPRVGPGRQPAAGLPARLPRAQHPRRGRGDLVRAVRPDEGRLPHSGAARPRSRSGSASGRSRRSWRTSTSPASTR